jgi:hypothetical protein
LENLIYVKANQTENLLYMISYILILCIIQTFAFDTIGWFVEGCDCNEMTADSFPFQYYSHGVLGNPIVFENGTAICNTSDTLLQQFIKNSKKYGKRVIWHDGLTVNNIWHLLLNESWSNYKLNYLNSIGNAVSECGVDGIEIDYECPDTILGHMGIVSDYEATKYTEFLMNIKKAIGTNKQVGCDMGIWGVSRGSYPFMFNPWINVSMTNNGAIDYINIMSYHSFGNIFSWEKDGFVLTKIWKLNSNKINLGIPYFFYNKTFNEPLWCQLSEYCPNIDPNNTTCSGIHIVSKELNFQIGQYVKNNNFRGVFPWAANYDSLKFNNSMIKWVYNGLYN